MRWLSEKKLQRVLSNETKLLDMILCAQHGDHSKVDRYISHNALRASLCEEV